MRASVTSRATRTGDLKAVNPARLLGDTTADLTREGEKIITDVNSSDPSTVAHTTATEPETTTTETTTTETTATAPAGEASATKTTAAPASTTAAPLAVTTTSTTTVAPVQNPLPTAMCSRTITANVVALDQLYTYNRFDAFNPAGMMYALRRDVTLIDTMKGFVAGNVRLKAGKNARARSFCAPTRATA